MHPVVFGEAHMPDVATSAGAGGPVRAVDDLGAVDLCTILLMGAAEGQMVRSAIGAACKKLASSPAMAQQLFFYMHARPTFGQAKT